MTAEALQKSIAIVNLILSGMQTAQGLMGKNEEQHAAAKALVEAGAASNKLLAPEVLTHPAVDAALDRTIESIVGLTHAHADAAAA
jgi:hypothetical protein